MNARKNAHIRYFRRISCVLLLSSLRWCSKLAWTGWYQFSCCQSVNWPKYLVIYNDKNEHRNSFHVHEQPQLKNIHSLADTKGGFFRLIDTNDDFGRILFMATTVNHVNSLKYLNWIRFVEFKWRARDESDKIKKHERTVVVKCLKWTIIHSARNTTNAPVKWCAFTTVIPFFGIESTKMKQRSRFCMKWQKREKKID